MRGVEYKEQDQPIYRFQLTNGRVERLEPIKHYSKSTLRLNFKVDDRSGSIQLSNLDKIVSDRIYTLVDDKARAEAMFKTYYILKCKAAENEFNKLQEKLDSLKF